MSDSTLQNDVLALMPKTDKKASFSSKKDSTEQEQSNNNESFLTSLLQAIDDTNKFLPQNLKISEKEIVVEVVDKLQNGSFDEMDKMSIFENASFMQILSMLDKMQLQSDDIKFNNLSNQLKQNIINEQNFNSLKNANSLNELLDIAKNLNLNVQNIKVDRLLDLKAAFPNLDKKDFFKNSIDNIFKELINHKISNLTKNIDKNEINNITNKNSKDSNLLLKTLQNIDALIKDKKINTKKDEIKNIDETINTKLNFSENNEKNKIVLDKNLDNLDEKINVSKENIKPTKEENIKNININNKIIEKDIKIESTTKTQELKIQDDNIKNNDNAKINNIDNKENKKQDIKKEIIQNFTKDNIKQSEISTNNKEITKEQVKENKNVNLENNLSNLKINSEGLKQTQTINHKEFNNNLFENKQQENTKEISKIENIENTNNKEDNFDLNNLVRDLSKTNQNQMKNQANIKETLNYFSQDLKESLEQYKAPITKLSITLNPSNLGEVEVTLIQRGNNLHINFNSNTNAMNLFIQNQNEFKNSLVNMGFTGLEMNFSDQGKKDQRDQNQNKNRSGYGFSEEIESIDNNQNLELILAKYF